MANNKWKSSVNNGDWNDDSNWELGHRPRVGETAVITHGNPTIVGGGVALKLEVDGGAKLDIAPRGTSGNGSLVLGGDITNLGEIRLNGGAGFARLDFYMNTQLGLARINGGKITLSDSNKNIIGAGPNGATISNTSEITGAGEIGNGDAIHFVNQAGGKIIGKSNSTNQLSFYLGSLSGKLTNHGLIEDQGKGGVEFYRTKVDNFGVIQAMSAGSHIDISDSSITGGILRTSNAGGIIQTFGNSNQIANLAIQGHLRVNPNTTLEIKGNIQNTGTIEIDADGTQARIRVHGDDARLTGVGELVLSDDDGNIIYGAGQGAELTNFGHVIRGAGSIGHGSLTIHNYGVITATGIENELVFRSNEVSTNHGVLSATGPAGLVIANSTINSAGGGQIIANAPGAHVDLVNAVLQGGTLRTTGAGAEIRTEDNSRNNVLDGSINAVSNQGLLVVSESTALELRGSIKNGKTIEVEGGTHQADLRIGRNGATLTGNGDIELSNSRYNNVTGLTQGSRLTNQDNEISGAGTIGHMTLVNGVAGTIRANHAANALIVRTGATITNNGRLVADGARLDVEDAVIGTGSALIANGGVLELNGSTQSTIFSLGANELELGRAYGGLIYGFNADDKVALEFLSFSSGYRASWTENASYTGGTLHIVDAAGTVRASVNFTGFGSHTTFRLSNDGGYVAITLGTAELVTTGTSAGETLIGNGLPNTLRGLGGNDRLYGLAGDDTLDGGTGADIMVGGLGNDVFIVDQAGDRVIEYANEGTDRVESAAISLNLANYANVEHARLTGAANLNLTGSAGQNVLTGNSGANVLNGLGGADVMRGGAGTDNYYVDNVGDIVDESLPGSNGGDIIRSSISLSLADTVHVKGAVENLALLGTANINATGNALNNVLAGNSGNNVIAGGLGNDTLTGAGGADYFVFNTTLNALTNIDRITDFSVPSDTMRLENAIFTGLGAATGTLASAAFWSSSTGIAHDASDRIVYNSATGALNYDADGTGGAGAIRFATLATGLALSNLDFFVI